MTSERAATVLSVECLGPVAVLAIHNPPVNALAAGVRSALSAPLDGMLSDPLVSAIVLTGIGEHFSAGVDMREVEPPPMGGAPRLGELIDRIELAEKPIVAALHGTVAGGALERRP